MKYSSHEVGEWFFFNKILLQFHIHICVYIIGHNIIHILLLSKIVWKLSPESQFQLTSCFYKVLLAQSHAHLFSLIWGCFHITMKNWDSTEALYNLKYLLSGFYRSYPLQSRRSSQITRYSIQFLHYVALTHFSHLCSLQTNLVAISGNTLHAHTSCLST